MTTSFIPRSTARWSCRAGFSPMNCFEMTGLVPTKSQVSASSRRFRPPSHRPCTASAIMIPGWSIVAAEKNIVDPSARSIAAAMPPIVG